MTSIKVRLRRGTAAQWASANPVLASGEAGFETDTNVLKIGDGVTAYNSLSAIGGSGGGANLTWTAATSTVASDTGTDAVITLADGTNPGLMSSADFTKLAAITGTNTGDQTSIVGITGTKAQFDTAVTDGNFLYVGDVTSNATHTGDVTGATALTIDPTAITGKTAVTAVGADYLLISDTSDSGNLKKALASDLMGGSLALNDLTDATITSAAEGQALVRGATEFVNQTMMTVTLGPFYINDMGGTTTTDATLGYFNTATAVSRNSNEIKMQTAGRVVGLVMVSDAARTAGTATAVIEVNNTSQGFASGAVALDATNTTSDSAFVAWGSGVSFNAGDTLGCEVTTSAWTPTTANFTLWLVVMLKF